MRSIDEQVKDMLLELFLLQEASPCDEMDSRMKVQKLHFICQKQMTENHVKGTDLNFFTLWRGPFSKVLANDLRALERLGFITGSHHVTKRGQALLKEYREVFERDGNAVVVEHILTVLRQYGDLSAEQLEDLTHNMPIMPVGLSLTEPVPLKKLPAHVDLLIPLDPAESRVVFQMTDDELESLQLSFCWAEEDLENMRLSSSRSHEELFGEV